MISYNDNNKTEPSLTSEIRDSPDEYLKTMEHNWRSFQRDCKNMPSSSYDEDLDDPLGGPRARTRRWLPSNRFQSLRLRRP
mmetsp:Transcript_9991/g.27632  ORF Transcript_9991/g.27632 Transcript_9991/m.27632 type:complete len:81 (+) Transcript_9991:56-298(+)